MKRITTLFLTVLSLLAILTGCVHEDIGITLNADGTGKVAATVGIDKDAYNQFIGMGMNLFADAESEPVEYEYKGKTYIALTETKEYASFEELREALLDLTYETDEIPELTDIEDEWETDEDTDFEVEDEDGAKVPAIDNHIFKEVTIEKKSGMLSETYLFSAKMNAIPDDPEISLRENSKDSDTSMSSAFLVTVSVEMPSEITTASNNATVEGNKATFEIDDLSVENEFSVVADQTNNVVFVAVIVVLVLVLIGLILVAKSRAKDKK